MGKILDELVIVMLYKETEELYKKLRLLHYRRLFGQIRERDGSLSATEAFAVDMIYLLGNPTLGEFAANLGISQPNATYKVNNLIDKGYVIKTASEEDRRECRLCVTEKFYAYYGTQNDAINHAVEKLKSEFSEAELDTFEKMIWWLNKSMK